LSGVDSALTILEIFRDTPDDVQDRWIRVSIDDGPEEILRYGATLRYEVPPGPHRIKAHNTLSRDAVAVDGQPGETIRLRCWNRVAKGGVLMMLTTGFAFITVRLERVAP
jgi:hypothetical protein